SEDFNKDCYVELAAANYGMDNVVIFFENKNFTFANQITISTAHGSRPHSITVGFFTNDDNPDIAVPNYGSNEIVSIGAGDSNHDNRPDLIVTNNGTNNTGLFLGSGNSTFDIIMVTNGTATIDILLGSFEGFINLTRFSIGSGPQSVAVGDFNNDTRLDIIVTNHGSDYVSVLLGYGDGSFVNQSRFSAGSYAKSVAVGDFNNDTRLDIVVVNLGTNDVSVLLASINYIGFLKQSTLTTGNGSRPRSLVIDDFNHGSQMDLAVANSGFQNIAVFLGYDNYSFVNPTILATGSEPMSIASGDFNDDTRFDVVVANYASRSVSIFLGYGNDSFINQTIYSTGSDSYPYFVAVGDFNNDISLDIIIVIQYTNNVGILLGYPGESFRD
ncbi:unnamed protein product, partial [Rotaria magnacalcarata]